MALTETDPKEIDMADHPHTTRRAFLSSAAKASAGAAAVGVLASCAVAPAFAGPPKATDQLDRAALLAVREWQAAQVEVDRLMDSGNSETSLKKRFAIRERWQLEFRRTQDLQHAMIRALWPVTA